MRRYARKHHGRVANVTLTGLVCAGMLLRLAVSVATGDRPGQRAWCSVLADTLGMRAPATDAARHA